jgi:hypothetical protein
MIRNVERNHKENVPREFTERDREIALRSLARDLVNRWVMPKSKYDTKGKLKIQ